VSPGVGVRGVASRVSYRWSTHAKVAELADAPDLGSGGVTHGGSSPPFRTIQIRTLLTLFTACNASNFSVNFWHQGICVWLGFVSTHLPVVDCADDQKEN
jgi:hypothetical protein